MFQLCLQLVTFAVVSAGGAPAMYGGIYDSNPVCTFKADPNPVPINKQTTFSCTCDPPANQTFIYKVLLKAGTGEEEWGNFSMGETWVLPSVADAQLGLYRCWSKFVYEESFPSNQVTENTTLTAIYPPSEVQIKIEPNPVYEDGTFTVSCKEFSGDKAKHYEFFYEGKLVKEVDAPENSYEVSPALKADHEGNWYCRAVNDAGGNNSPTEFLDVIERPKEVTVDVDPETVPEGGEFKVTCSQKGGNPATSYNFYVNDTLIEEGSVSATITVSSAVEADHEGLWTCDAVNDAGKRPSENKDPLEVTVSPKKVTVDVDPETVPEGGEFKVTCSQDGGDPATSYNFYVNDTLIKEGSASSAITVTPAVEADHEGLWTCDAVNDAGKTPSDNKDPLEVTVKPRTTTVTVDPKSVFQGEEVTISCSHTGGDAATSYTFKRNGNDFETVTAPTDLIKLNPAIKVTHEGDWTCTAKNAGGETPSSNTEPLAIILKPTTVNLVPKPSVVRDCESMILMAEIDNPEAVVDQYIFKNSNTGVELTTEPGKDSVTIDPVDKALHEGSWTVVAKGAWGEVVSHPVYITIKDNTFMFTVGCDNRKYVINNCRKTHSEATDWCKAQGMELAVIGDSFELQNACEKILNFDPTLFNVPYWVGVSRDSPSGVWMDNICNKPALYIANANQNSVDVGNCLAVYMDRMVPRDCDTKRPFVCVQATCDVASTIKVGGDTYHVISRPRTRDQAEFYCWSLGMELFSINSFAEMQGVCVDLLTKELSTTPFWTGPKYDQGEEKWLDGCFAPIPTNIQSIMKYGEYENSEEETCTVIQDDYYYVRPCHECRGFICEKQADNCDSRRK